MVPYNAIEVMNLFYILIPLFVLNISFEIYNYIYKRKSEPILYSSYWTLIIQLLSQLLLIVFILTNVFLWRNATIEAKKSASAYLFVKNKYYETVENVFSQKSAVNLTIVIFVFLFIGLDIFGLNIRKIFRVVEKDILQSQSKDKYVLSLAILVSALFAFIKVMTIKIRFNILGSDDIYNYMYLLFIVAAIVISIIYFIVVHFNSRVNKSTVVFTLIMSLSQLMLWTLVLISLFTIENASHYVYNIFAVGILSVAIFIHFIITNRAINKFISSCIRLTIAIQTILIFTFSLNQILIAQNNFILISVPTPISMIQILAIFNFAVLLGFFIVSATQIFIALQKAQSRKQKAEREVI
ncbi:MSC_0624 family F1-like ATPase-associated membrane protein [Mycoplasmopsis felifaucium]|uniref:MSC_0624 family F1-like ATPase-associated membrane protein n=1 Tax=Mycoplasmopsis felifaucium TaxID=35768 RepID=UPI000483E92E|nr:hypothetical protein [Mycoplasmopsis felifaucium]